MAVLVASDVAKLDVGKQSGGVHRMSSIATSALARFLFCMESGTCAKSS